MRQVFVDSSAWIALHNRRDNNHAAAASALLSLQDSPTALATSDYVVDEALTHIRMWGSHSGAVEFGNTIRSHALVDWIEVDSEIWEAAWDIFVRYDDKVFSFTDCTSFAIMHAKAIREAFTFDSDFEMLGFKLFPLRAPKSRA